MPTIKDIGAPTVFAKFQSKEMLGEMGRLLFWVLNTFASSGYQIRLFDNLSRAALDKYGRLACALPQVALTGAVPPETEEMIYLFDKEDRALAARSWRKRVQIRFDVFSPYWFSRPMIVPYPMHPVHAGADLVARLQRHREARKKMRIFFSGDTKGYVASRIKYPQPKLPRSEVIDTILRNAGEKALLVGGEEDLDRRCSAGYVNACLIMEQDSRIQDARWLETLATSDFFLCPPGYVMPMCHNTVEAMGVGTIPIINYAEWFDPSLEHMRNCVVFHDRSDLLAKMDQVLAMDQGRIAAMRQAVIAYYEEHLAPQSFMRKVEASNRSKVTVLLITDANVSRNAAKLNARSVLIRGKGRSRSSLERRQLT